MAAAAAFAERAPCYFYSRNAESAENFTNWKCSVCHEEDAALNGGTVAHDPTHPIHLNCLLSWAEQHQTCPNCRATVDVSQIVSLSTKCKLAARQAINSLTRCVQRISKPTLTVYTGLGLIILGWKTAPLISGIGWILQLHGIHKGLQFGAARVPLAKEIQRLATEISHDLATEKPFADIDPKLEALKGHISYHPSFREEMPAITFAFDSKDRDLIEQSLKKSRQLADCYIFGDLYLRSWRVMCGAMVLYSAYRAV